MRTPGRPTLNSGFTLIEVMVVVAVVAIVLTIAAPSFRDMIELQRLRSVNAQFVTDVQFTRSEAVTRQEVIGISFDSDSTRTCYIIHSCGTWAASDCTCDCKAATSNRCPSPAREIRTVEWPKNAAVSLLPVVVTGASSAANRLMFDPATGGVTTYFYSDLFIAPTTPAHELWVEAALIRPGTVPRLRTEIGPSGRPRVCAPGGGVSGVSPCA
jgi:type IV fimbrial biogenesis protein FimT